MATRPAFKDHFSGHSDAYERYRPDYPAALDAWLAGQSPARKLALDVATGNGQAAVGLAGHFDAVVGLEPSAEQLRQAFIAGVRCVLRPDGVLAIGCYELFDCDPAIDRLVNDFSRHVEEGYRNLATPFPSIDAPPGAGACAACAGHSR